MMIDLPFDIVELVACPMTATPPAPSPTAPLRETAYRVDAWLPEDIERLQAMFKSDAAFDAIEAAIGRSPFAVRGKLAELGLRRHSSRPWTDLEDEELARRYGTDATSSIAADLGRSVAAVYARAAGLGLTEGNAPAYTGWEIAQIRAAYRDGVAVAQLAVLIGRPASGIATIASHLGIAHANAPEDWSAAEQEQALSLAEDGLRYRQIAAHLAERGFATRTHTAVGQVLRKLGYTRGWGRPWSPEEDHLIRAAYARGDSLTPLQRRLGRTPCSVRFRAGELGLRGTHVRPNGWRTEPAWTPAEIETLRRDYGRVPTPQLAASLGRKKGGVFNKAHAIGLVHGYIRGFSEEEKVAIRIAHRVGLSLTDLSLALDRDVAVVSKHAIRRLGLSFKTRPIAAPRGPLRLRRVLTLADILRLDAAEGRQVQDPGQGAEAPETAVGTPERAPRGRRGDRCRATAPNRLSAPVRPATPAMLPRQSGMPRTTMTLVAGPGVPTAYAAILDAMLQAGLLVAVGHDHARILLPARSAAP